MLDTPIVCYDKCFLSCCSTVLHISEKLLNFHLTVDFSDFLFLRRAGFILWVGRLELVVGDEELILRACIALSRVYLRSLTLGDFVEARQSDSGLELREPVPL